MEWTAGHYSPLDRVERIYLPADDDEFRSVMNTYAHELTHHWLSMRWLGKGNMGRAAVVPGYWIVEGFARFIEDQAMEMGRRAGRLGGRPARRRAAPWRPRSSPPSPPR